LKKKFFSLLIAAVMLVSFCGITPAYAASPAVVTFSGPTSVSPGQIYTYTYTLKVTNACAANANISVGGAFEKVSGGENLFYDTIPENSTGTVSGSVTVRVKSDATPNSVGTISVLEDESKCSELVFDDSGKIIGDPVITTVTGSHSVRVGPPVPAAPSVTFLSGNSLNVKWNAVPYAGGYQVFIATSANGPYGCIDTVPGTKTSTVVSGLSPNTTYYLKIRGFYQEPGSSPVFGDLSDYGAGTTQPNAPAAPSVTFLSGNSLNVKWDTVPNAGGYQVFMATSANGPYRCVDTVPGTKTSTVVSGLSPNTTYYLKVRGFYQEPGSSPVFGNLSDFGSGATQPNAPAAPSVTFLSGNSLNVKWNAVPYAGGYQVFMATSANGMYACIDTVPGTKASTVVSGLSPNTSYYFRIRAFYQAPGSSPVFGNLSDFGSCATQPNAPAAPSVTFLSGSSLNVKWNAVPYAGGYQVFIATSANGMYACIDTVPGTKTSTVVSGLSPNTTYYFKVRPFYQEPGSSPIFGNLSDYGAGTTQPNAPAAPSVTSVSSSSLNVKWNAVPYAGGYQVFMATSANGMYACIDTVPGTKTSTVVSGLAPNTTYYFRIRAFYQEPASSPVFGNLSAPGSGTTSK